MTASPSLYSLEGVRVNRGGRPVLDVPALDIASGELVAVVGPNGAGKTTLLRVLAFLLPPDEGRVHFRDRVFEAPSTPPLELRRPVAMVMQQPYLFSGSVLSNARYGLKARGVPRAESEARAREALEHVGLGKFADRLARTLSGGEAKRLAVARVLALNPDVLLLDEPTADVDEEQRLRIEEIVRHSHRERGTTVILSTHDKTQALRLEARILSLSGGKIVQAHPENVIPGRIVLEGGETLFRAEGLEIRVPRTEPGPIHASVDPSVIFLSLEAPKTSAKNVFEARVTAVAEERDKVRVTVDPGVPLVVYVTADSAKALSLTVGKRVFASFKAHSVRILR